MARPLRIEFADAFYHVTARGNERKNIYRDERDKERFLCYLESAVDRYKAVIHVYCLMDNHYHLLLSTPLGNLSRIIRHINGAYTNYFNKRHKRVGHLLQGRYKAIVVNADEYAGELSRYIHLNPVRAGVVGSPEKYLWTSYPCYTGAKKTMPWLTTDWLLLKFGKGPTAAQRTYRIFVEAKIGVTGENPLTGTIASTILGCPDFTNDIKERHLGSKRRHRDIPAIGMLKKAVLDEIIKTVQSKFQDKPDLSKKIAIYLSHRFSGLSLKEIGKEFGIKESAVSQASRRFESALLENVQLSRRVDELREFLNLSNV